MSEVSSENENREVNSANIEQQLREALEANEQLKSTNSRLLDEAYHTKQKNKTLRGQVDGFEEMRKAKLSAEERLAEDQKEIQKLRGELEEEKDRLFELNALNTIRKVAPDARNADVLINLPNVKSMLEIDEEKNSITFESAEAAINSLRESDSYLFQKPKVQSMGAGEKPKSTEGWKSASEKIGQVGMRNASMTDLKQALRETFKSKRK